MFHSLDKVISLTIHIYPPFVFTMIRHYIPTAEAEARYPALAKLPTIKPWACIGVNMLAYLIWQGLYFRYVIIARKEKIKQGRVTSFTWMINDKKVSLSPLPSLSRAWQQLPFCRTSSAASRWALFRGVTAD